MSGKTGENHQSAKYDENQILVIKKIYRDLRQIREEHLEALKTLREDNKRFLALIGHDIRTPISSIIGYLSVLKERIHKLGPNEVENHIDTALLSAKRTFMMLENLLEWALIENEIRSFRQKETNLKLLLADEIENIGLYASTKKITIELNDIVSEPVYIDANMISTVFRNLLNNAVKFTPEGGLIAISTKKNNNFIEVTIKDSGVGMSQDMQDLIFTEKSSNTNLGTGSEHGTGFGLILCKGFIDKHGGKIRVESDPGSGSAFRFTLPMSSSVTN